jgi:serine O-acetyltransferase
MAMDSLTLYRAARRLHAARVPLAPRLLRRLGLLLFSSYLPHEAEVGEGTWVGYAGTGVFVHPEARIGRNCLLSPFVSIGGRSGLRGAPTLGDHVLVGAGARILGPVRVGDFAIIGANSVVVRDVPPATVVFGVPARVVRRLEDPAAEYERSTGRPAARAPGLTPVPAPREGEPDDELSVLVG